MSSTCSIKQALTWAQEKLSAEQRFASGAALDAQVLLASALNKRRTYLFTWPETTLQEQSWEVFQQAITRRLSGEPVAYIVGHKDFWGLSFAVNVHTLIPRPETEHLVEQALFAKPAQSLCRVLELGTGSGAIACALAHERPAWSLVATDKSSEALKVAQSNSAQLGLSNIEFRQGDWFGALQADETSGFDLILSNPPYIEEGDPLLQVDVARYEPLSALISEERGLADLRYLIENSKQYLAADGMLVLEHGWQQGQAVRDLLAEHGFLRIKTHRDLADHERLTIAMR